MKIKKIIQSSLCFGLLLSVTLGASGCRKLSEETGDKAAGEVTDILYQTYCEDTYKAYQADSTAALTFYTDGTYSIGQCTGLNLYTMESGTWEVEDGELSLYNVDGELVGNGEDTDLDNRDTWAVWGCFHYDNLDGTLTDYYSKYAFDISDNGDFVLTMDTQTYYYWGQNGHISSDYIHTFTAEDFIEAYNAEYDGTLDSISLNTGTGMPVPYYEQTGTVGFMGFQNGEQAAFSMDAAPAEDSTEDVPEETEQN